MGRVAWRCRFLCRCACDRAVRALRPSLAKVEDDDALRGVATFSAENMMDLRWGYDRDALLLKELQYCFQNATVVEEMLCSVLHMQVDVCFLRFGRGRHYNGLPMYRKNIIAFPQELAEVKQMLSFWTSVRVGDVVNVACRDGDASLYSKSNMVRSTPPTAGIGKTRGWSEILTEM